MSRIQVIINEGMKAILKAAPDEPIKNMLKELDFMYFSDQVYIDTMTYAYSKLRTTYYHILLRIGLEEMPKCMTM